MFGPGIVIKLSSYKLSACCSKGEGRVFERTGSERATYIVKELVKKRSVSPPREKNL